MIVQPLLAHASATLEHLGARLIDFSEVEVSVEVGMGGRKRRKDVSIATLTQWVEAHPGSSRLAASSFFRGVAAVLLAPQLTRRERQIGFAEAAARLSPSLEGPLFVAGASAAGVEAFGYSPFGGLFMAHYIEFDRGRVLVSAEERARWNVSVDRLEKAATSLIYHHTIDEVPSAVPELDGVVSYSFGDGAGAARAALLEPLYYLECRAGLAFAVPHNDVVLFAAPGGDAPDLDAFASRVEAIHKRHPAPLSRDLFVNRGGAVEPLGVPVSSEAARE